MYLKNKDNKMFRRYFYDGGYDDMKIIIINLNNLKC